MTRVLVFQVEWAQKQSRCACECSGVMPALCDTATENRMVDNYARFAWYELLTTDMAAARTFYSSVLGWRTHDASTPQFSYSVFSAGETAICGLMDLPPDGQQAGATPRWVGYIAVDDIRGTVDQLRRRGG